MKISVPGLVARATAGGQRFYWTPSPSQRAAKWKGLSLGSDIDTAIAAAKARNEAIETWRTGGAKPRAVATFVKRATVSALTDRYKREHLTALDDRGKPRFQKTTQHTYTSALNRIEAVFGDLAAASITRKHVRLFRDAMMRPKGSGKGQGGVGHTTAHATLRTLRTLFQWGVDHEHLTVNVAERFDLGMPEPRDQMWEREDEATFAAAALHDGQPSMAFAVALAAATAQREGDLIKLQTSQYRELLGIDEDDRRKLTHDDGPYAGRAMAVFIRQGKGKRWVGIPVAGDSRRSIEAAIATNTARGVTTILTNDESGLPWEQRHFIRRFNEVRTLAITGFTDQHDVVHAPRPELADLQFRDLRRTAIVRLGELNLEDQAISAISGHKLASIKRILETYMPRTTKMAARAVVASLDDARARRADMAPVEMQTIAASK